MFGHLGRAFIVLSNEILPIASLAHLFVSSQDFSLSFLSSLSHPFMSVPSTTAISPLSPSNTWLPLKYILSLSNLPWLKRVLVFYLTLPCYFGLGLVLKAQSKSCLSLSQRYFFKKGFFNYNISYIQKCA